MERLGPYHRLARGSPLLARWRLLTDSLRDFNYQLATGSARSEESIRFARQQRHLVLSELADLEVIVRRQGKVSAALLKTGSLMGVLKHFTVGFELETHATGDLDRSNIPMHTQQANAGRAVDPAKYASYVQRTIRRELNDCNTVINRASEPATQLAVQLWQFREWERKQPADLRAGAAQLIASGQWQVFTPKLTTPQIQDLIGANNLTLAKLEKLGALPTAVLRDWRTRRDAELRAGRVPDECRTGRTWRGVELVENHIPNWDGKLLEVGTDGSVRGFEIRTRGALTVPNFIKAAGIVFGAQHTIDTGCSFHLHVGVRGAEMKYTPEFQSALMEYLLDNIDKVPDSVVTRWRTIGEDGAGARYFRPLISTDKYSFVHYHNRCNTWEFRCFGNVHNKADAVRCLKLAIRAMLYAYRVTRAGQVPIINHVDVNAKLGREIIKCITKREPLSKVVAAARSL